MASPYILIVIKRWIKDFIYNRVQSVVVKGEHSSYVPVTSGVPQGSILGPCFFLYYINDLPENLNSTVRLFADDTIAYPTVKSEKREKCCPLMYSKTSTL